MIINNIKEVKHMMKQQQLLFIGKDEGGDIYYDDFSTFGVSS